MATDLLLSRITSSPEICHGKPCVRGLRYPVEFLLELLSGDSSVADILADYPDLEPDDLKAVHAYAAKLAKSISIASPPPSLGPVWLNSPKPLSSYTIEPAFTQATGTARADSARSAPFLAE